jgi:hypothetical protein
MNTLSLKQIELNNLIRHFDIQDIEKMVSFVKDIKSINKKSSRKSLAGIWSDIDFNNIDIDNEVRELRSDVTKNLDKILL